MPLQIDAFNKIIEITSPDTSVDLQTLHDFVEDYMASPIGLANDSGDVSFFGDILKPEGKIEDPSQPGVFSQIILILNSEWQIQFWGGSGYTRIYGGKLVGGVSDQPFKATGTAGDITVLESPVDGLTVVSGSGVTAGDITAIGAQSAIDVWTRVIEGTMTAEEMQRVMAAVLWGDASGLTNGSPVFRNITNTKDRARGTIHPDGTRDNDFMDGT